MTINKIGFDNEKYLHEQSKSILDRATQFGNKLYLEFGEASSFLNKRGLYRGISPPCDPVQLMITRR